MDTGLEPVALASKLCHVRLLLVRLTPLLPDLKERFRSLVANVGTIAVRSFDKTRATLQELLSSQITLDHYSEGQERYVTAEILGLLRLARGLNKFGGGQAFLPSLTAALRFEIQGVALAT